MELRITIYVILLLLFSTFIYGNGVGKPVTKEIGNYSVEFGIDPVIPKQRERVIMSVAFQTKNHTPLAVSHVFVRIAKDNSILFATTDLLTRDDGPAYLIFQFPESGQYTVDIGATINSEKIVHSFPVTVAGRNYLFLYLAIAVSLGVIIGYYLKRRLH